MTRNNGYSHAEGGVATSYPAFGAFGARLNSLLASALLFAGVLIAPAVSVAQVTAPGTVIRNVGTVAYQAPGGLAATTLSNEVALAVQPPPSRATIQLARYEAGSQSTFTAGPTQCRASNGFVSLGAPSPQGTGTLDPLVPIPMQDTGIAHAGDPIFVRVVDLDRNRDGAVVETVDVRVTARSTGDAETLRLSETGPSTGVFVGYIPTNTGTVNSDCALQVQRNSEFDASYVDPTDDTDTAEADALVDPFGLVFDSQTGAAIFAVQMMINVPSRLPIAQLREDFMEYCDSQNLDAILEPVKN
jgi:hypothetical protein